MILFWNQTWRGGICVLSPHSNNDSSIKIGRIATDTGECVEITLGVLNHEDERQGKWDGFKIYSKSRT